MGVYPDSKKGWVFTNQSGKQGSWSHDFYGNKDVFFKFMVKGKLSITVSTLESRLTTSVDSKNWLQKVVKIPEAQGRISVQVMIAKDSLGYLASVEPVNCVKDLDQLLDYKTDERKFSKQKKATFPLGVNLEAEYLFLELTKEQRFKLLRQIVFDGFSTIRIHKFFRVAFERGFSPQVMDEFSEFVEQAYQIGLDLYFDLVSWPYGYGFSKGWKGYVFTEFFLNDKIVEWVKKLSSLKIGGIPFFKHKRLKWICLFNENSLYHEQDTKMLFTQLKMYHSFIRDYGFVSMNKWRKFVMQKSFFGFVELLDKYSYKGLFFLSNYQSGSEDLEANQFYLKPVDRHLYFDYPWFLGSRARVRNHSLISRLDEILKDYKNLRGSSDCYISELNLPWPNRWQHELVPTILFLHKCKRLKGLWFYDYRLRTDKFHEGGIFGIQKFHSIIGQLKYLKRLWNKDYEIKRIKQRLRIKDKDVCMLSGSFLDQKSYGTLWFQDNDYEWFSFEKAMEDQFDSNANEQLSKGATPVTAVEPENINSIVGYCE
jgi:hypothetical protein